jgi:hypothetical protein
MIETISYENIEYPTRIIEIPSWGVVTISTIDLSKKLLTSDSGNYVNKQAQYIDESIFYYVDNNELDMPEIDLRKQILKELS